MYLERHRQLYLILPKLPTDTNSFWTLGLPEQVHSNCPCPWSVIGGPFVFRYLRESSLVFLEFCMNLGHQKGTTLTEPDF